MPPSATPCERRFFSRWRHRSRRYGLRDSGAEFQQCGVNAWRTPKKIRVNHLAGQLISYTAMNGVAVLFPVVITHQYAMPAILPASAYAVGVAASLLLYRRVSTLAKQRSLAVRLMTSPICAREAPPFRAL